MLWIYEKPNEYVVFCFAFYIKKSLSEIVAEISWGQQKCYLRLHRKNFILFG